MDGGAQRHGWERGCDDWRPAGVWLRKAACVAVSMCMFRGISSLINYLGKFVG